MGFFKGFPKTSYNFPSSKEVEVVDLFRSAMVVDDGIKYAATFQNFTIENERPDQLAEKLYKNTNFYWTFFIVNRHLRDGWPLSFAGFKRYIEKEYSGYGLTLYREEDDLATYNSIAGKYTVDGTITGLTSGVVATISKRDPRTNTIYFEYKGDTTFTPNESLEIMWEVNNDTYQDTITEKYYITESKDSPHHFEENGRMLTNPENYDYRDKSVSNLEYEDNRNEENKKIKVVREDYIEDFVVAYRKAINGER